MKGARSPKVEYPMPFVRTELVVLCVQDGQLQVLMSRRQEEPHKGLQGLPGGVLRIDLDESLENAAQRVASERLGQPVPNLSQVCAVGGKYRDERAPWALSVVYRSLVQPDLKPTPGKRVVSLDWLPVDEVIGQSGFAFDHAKLVERAVADTREQIAALQFPAGWVPEPFTMPELQAFCEAVLGRGLDKVTFRRRVDALGLVEPVPGAMRTGGAFRPAQLCRFAVGD